MKKFAHILLAAVLLATFLLPAIGLADNTPTDPPCGEEATAQVPEKIVFSVKDKQGISYYQWIGLWQIADVLDVTMSEDGDELMLRFLETNKIVRITDQMHLDFFENIDGYWYSNGGRLGGLIRYEILFNRLKTPTFRKVEEEPSMKLDVFMDMIANQMPHLETENAVEGVSVYLESGETFISLNICEDVLKRIENLK